MGERGKERWWWLYVIIMITCTTFFVIIVVVVISLSVIPPPFGQEREWAEDRCDPISCFLCLSSVVYPTGQLAGAIVFCKLHARTHLLFRQLYSIFHTTAGWNEGAVAGWYIRLVYVIHTEGCDCTQLPTCQPEVLPANHWHMSSTFEDRPNVDSGPVQKRRQSSRSMSPPDWSFSYLSWYAPVSIRKSTVCVWPIGGGDVVQLVEHRTVTSPTQVPRCGKGFFSQCQLSVHALL